MMMLCDVLRMPSMLLEGPATVISPVNCKSGIYYVCTSYQLSRQPGGRYTHRGGCEVSWGCLTHVLHYDLSAHEQAWLCIGKTVEGHLGHCTC